MKWIEKYENGLYYMREKLYLEGLGNMIVNNERIDGWLDELKKIMIQLEELPNPDTNQIEVYDGIYWDIVNLMEEFSLDEILDELNKEKTIPIHTIWDIPGVK